MSWVITGAEKTPVDKLGIQNVSLLLHGNADGSGNVLDSSPSPKTVSKFGNTASATPPSYPNSNSAFGNAIAFDGTGDYLTVPDASSLRMETGDFTIEFWWYPSSLTDFQTPFDKGYTEAGALLLQTGNGDGKIIVYGSGSAVISAATAVTASSWNHIAVTRNLTTLRLFLNGNSLGSASSSLNFNNTRQVGIGANGTSVGATAVGRYPINGYIDDLRITKGVARYTANFTPPTAPFPDI